MLIATLRDLQWRRRRFIIAILGTALVFAMTLVAAGLSHALVLEVDRTLSVVGADRWVIASGGTSVFNSSAVLPDTAVAAIRNTPGVIGADPFLAIHGTIGAKQPQDITMIGAVPGGVGSPRGITTGRSPRHNGEVALSSLLGEPMGARVSIGGQSFRVVGLVPQSSLYGGMANVFMTLHDVQRVIFAGAPLATAIAIRGHTTRAPTGTRLLDNAHTRHDILDILGAGFATIRILALLLWVVAGCIIGSVVYLCALERVRDFAVFKATGTSTTALMMGLAVQAIIVSLLAGLVGVVIARGLAPLIPVPAQIPANAYVLLPVVAVAVGLVASLAGLRRAVTVSPALAFGGA